MKTYKKQEPPEVLHKWEGSHRPWEDFVYTPNAYEPVKQKLLQEQNHLCCYCESKVEDSDSHIEHYEPRSCNQNRTYDYANLACSCYGGKGKDRHCGARKGREFDAVLFINPSTEDSDPLFSYDAEGAIGPRPDVSADEANRVGYMVRTLNLECARLTGMRRTHGRGIVQIIDGFINAGALHLLGEMARVYLVPDDNGKLQPFYSLSLQLFGEIGTEIIKKR